MSTYRRILAEAEQRRDCGCGAVRPPPSDDSIHLRRHPANTVVDTTNNAKEQETSTTTCAKLNHSTYSPIQFNTYRANRLKKRERERNELTSFGHARDDAQCQPLHAQLRPEAAVASEGHYRQA